MNTGGEDSAGDSAAFGSGGGAILVPGALAGAPIAMNPGSSLHAGTQRDAFNLQPSAGVSGADDSQTSRVGHALTGGLNSAPDEALAGPLAALQAAPCIMGGGVVGVASTIDQQGIRIYRNHSNYSEWEFVYERRTLQGAYLPCPGSPGADYRGAPGVALGGLSGGTPAPGGMTGGMPPPG